MSISSIGAINANDTAYGTSSTAANSAMDMDDFLTMFTTQLQHQDPTNPLESYELAAQLAQFSTVERLTETNYHLKEVKSYLSSMNNSMMVQMLGKEITANGNSLVAKEGQISGASYQIAEPSQVKIKIYDEAGQLVRTMDMGAQDAGRYQVEWDGCDDSGNRLEDGTYTFQAEAVNADGNSVEVEQKISGTCRAVHMKDGLVYLTFADGSEINPNSVIEVREAGPADDV